jgi:signal transduction histidine kinase
MLLLLAGCALMLLATGVQIYTEVNPQLGRAARFLENWISDKWETTSAILKQAEEEKMLSTEKEIFGFFQNKKLPPHTSVFIYNKDIQLQYWSDNLSLPPNPISLMQTEMRLTKVGNTHYAVKKMNLDDGMHALVLVGIYNAYPASNQYLRNGFIPNQPFLNRLTVNLQQDDAKRITKDIRIHNQVVFSIQDDPAKSRPSHPLLMIIEVLTFILIWIAINRHIRMLLIRNHPKKAAVLAFALILLSDLFINWWHLPSFTRANFLFSSTTYASPILGDSLGGLLTRIIMLHWVVRHGLKYLLRQQTLSNTLKKRILAALLTIFYYGVIFIIFSIHRHSVISLDLYNINLLDTSSLIAVFVIGLSISLLYLPISMLTPKLTDRQWFLFTIPFQLLMIGTGYLIQAFHSISFLIFSVLWFFVMLKVIQILLHQLEVSRRYRFIANIVILSLFAVQGAGALLHFSSERRMELYRQEAVELASERDLAEEYNISNILTEIAADNFIRNYFTSPYLSSVDLDRRIQIRYLNEYQAKYNIQIHAYNSDGNVLRGEGSKSLNELRSRIRQKKVIQASPFLFYLPVNARGEKYLAFFNVEQDSQRIGYLSIEFIPKIFTPYSAYPELLRSGKPTLDMATESRAYAIYVNRKLVSSTGDFTYSERLIFPLPENNAFKQFRKAGFEHILYRSGDKVVVYSAPEKPLGGTISLFSYLLLFLIFFFLITDAVGIHKHFWGKYSIRGSLRQDTLQGQIQRSMISLVLFSLLMVALVTVFYFTVQYSSYHNDRLMQRADSVLKSLDDYFNECGDDDEASAFEYVVGQRLKQLAETFGLDINVYGKNGNLLGSSQPEMFKRGIISSVMHPDAFYQLRIEGFSRVMQEEKIGRMSFFAAYLPFRGRNGEVLGYLNFPYYGKQRSIRNDISYFLVALVNIYVLLVLGAAAASIFLSRAVTQPLEIITQGIRRIELGRKNAPIEWKNRDEIGLLVKEYNRMLDELANSAALLARSEREGAWREMAKQVAHEIKNPLTPMKLSIQFLQRAIHEDREDLPELVNTISSRLVEQIETLSNIATAFSDFARMPLGKQTPVNVAEVLNSVTDLFASEETISLSKNISTQEVMVIADKDQLIRVFNNLLKNALQAITEQNAREIGVTLQVDNGQCMISISDNGVGIAPERAEKVFEPNFTTKTSGTGLGLAMSKSIIESAGGKIWFESNEPKGTVFFISLPLLQNKAS